MTTRYLTAADVGHARRAGDAWDRTPSSTGDYVCPVFSVRRPKPAPVVAAEGRYAVLVGGGVFRSFPGSFGQVAPRYVANRPDAGFGKLVRILDDGEHEAAIEAARRDGASHALTACRARLEYWLGLWVHRARVPEYPGDEVASGAKVEAYEQAILTIDEAAKGQV